MAQVTITYFMNKGNMTKGLHGTEIGTASTYSEFLDMKNRVAAELPKKFVDETGRMLRTEDDVRAYFGAKPVADPENGESLGA